jgi:hypothetical protein
MMPLFDYALHERVITPPVIPTYHLVHSSTELRILGDNDDELSAKQMEVDQEDSVANLLQAHNQPQQSNLPISTSSQDTVRSPNDPQYDASPPQTQYIVEGEDLKRPEVRLFRDFEWRNGKHLSISFYYVLYLGS